MSTADVINILSEIPIDTLSLRISLTFLCLFNESKSHSEEMFIFRIHDQIEVTDKSLIYEQQ